MPLAVEIERQLKDVFSERQAVVLASVIASSYDELVKSRDFNELKEIVRDIAKEQRELANAQKESQKEISRLDRTMQELAEAQKRTEIKVEELAEAQKRTEIKVEELAEAQKRTEIEIKELTGGLKETRIDLGGLSRSMGYAFENEAYRMLPSVLKERYGIEIKEKLIRAEIGGKEINILGKARRDGKEILIVGEAKLRLELADEQKRRKKIDIFEELEKKVNAVKRHYKEEILKILITHYATKRFIKKAKEQEIIVIQSFEW